MTQYSQQVEVTETNKIVSIKRKEFPTPVVSIQWFIGIRCQYDCQYCSPEWHNTTAPHWTLDQLKLAWNNLCKANEYRPGTQFSIAISGGEPTMNPDLMPWVQWIREQHNNKIRYLSVASNATQTVEYYKQLSQYVSLIDFGIHSEYVAEKRFFKLVEEVHAHSKANGLAQVRVLIPDEYWHRERTSQYVEYLTKKGINNKLLALHDFNPGKQPRTIKIHNRMNFDDTAKS